MVAALVSPQSGREADSTHMITRINGYTLDTDKKKCMAICKWSVSPLEVEDRRLSEWNG